MDNNQFDDIIRGKVETHTYPSGPSGEEMSKLFEQLPHVTSSSSVSINRYVSLVSSVLLITTFLMIYRTLRLENTIESLETEIIDLKSQQPQLNYLSDTIFWDSVQSIQNQVIISQSSSSRDFDKNPPSQLRLSAEDSQRFVNQVMAQLIAALESNPKMIRMLTGDQEVENIGIEETSATVTKEVLIQQISDANGVRSILKSIGEDPEEAEKLLKVINGYSGIPNEDNLSIVSSASSGDQQSIQRAIDELTENRAIEILESFLDEDPQKLADLAEKGGFSAEVVKNIQSYAASHDVDKREIALIDTLTFHRTLVRSNQEIRAEQKKVRNRSRLVGGGLGLGQLSLDELGNGNVLFLKVLAEYRPQQRWGFTGGLEFHTTEMENHDIRDVDFSNFEGLSQGIESNANEIKVSLQWLDVPLEAKMYLSKERKLNPYVLVSLRARALVGERYTFESSSGYESPDFTSDHKFIVPTYSYGLGSYFYLNPKMNGAFQVSHSLGGEGLGLFEKQFNTVQLQGILFFDLDK